MEDVEGVAVFLLEVLEGLKEAYECDTTLVGNGVTHAFAGVVRMYRMSGPSSLLREQLSLLALAFFNPEPLVVGSYQKSRGDWIRTSDLYVPNVALCQAELRPVVVLENGPFDYDAY